MSKNKKETKNKIPFNVLRKGALTAMIGLTVLGGATMMTGCATNGTNGKDGTIWKSGTSYTEFTDAKVGDFFIDIDDYILYQKTADSWTVVMNNYGRPGSVANDIEMRVDSGEIQWRYKTGTDTEWKNLLAVSTIMGANGYTPYIQDGCWYINGENKGPAIGNPGKEIEIQKGADAIQWRYEGDDEWIDLVSLSLLKGQDGTGTDGKSVKIAVNDGNVQWRYTDDSNEWQTIIAVNTLKGSDGTTPHIDETTGNWFIGTTDTGYKAAGVNGKEIKLQVTADFIQWKYEGDAEWNNLIPLSSLKGADGKDGATWISGEVAPTTEGKNGDFYLDETTFDIYKKTDGTWAKVGNIKGVGVEGPQGPAGQDGISSYVGYDGYIWNGADRTVFKATNISLGETVVENTIGIEGIMSKYFAGSYLDLTSNMVALMANYMPNAKLTQYSGTTVTEIKVYTESAGTLYIGTAEVADVVDARTNGTSSYEVSAEPYEVKAGLNTISLNLIVGEDETIVLGGQGSVGLYNAQGISADDEDGNFAYLNAQTNADVISKTNGTVDTLAIQVSLKDVIEYDLMPEILQTYPNGFESEGIKEFNKVQLGNAPFAFENKTMYAGKTVTKIGVYAYDILDHDNPFITVYKTKQTKTTGQKWTTNAESYKIVFPTTIKAKEWCYADCHINVAEDEMIAFGAASGDTIAWGYSNANLPDFQAINNTNAAAGTITDANILFDVWATDYASFEDAWGHHIADIKEQEEKSSLNYVLVANGINKISFLGDSITTYEGWTNNATDYNSTMETSYPVHYNDTKTASIKSVNDTWWKQILDITNTNLCVNNSYSGDKVTNLGVSRATQLHDDTGNPENGVVNPDMIFVYLGVNDFNDEVAIDTFAAKYEEMISGMKTKYANAKIYVGTILPNNRHINKALLDSYNATIREIATRLNIGVVDFYNDSGITYDNMLDYLWETGTNALHPNAQGMDAMTQTVINQLKKDYVTSSNN